MKRNNKSRMKMPYIKNQLGVWKGGKTSEMSDTREGEVVGDAKRRKKQQPDQAGQGVWILF